MKDDDRFAGLGAQALNAAERDSVVKLALEVMVEEVARGPVMSEEPDTAEYLRLKTCRREREVFGCLFLTTRHRHATGVEVHNHSSMIVWNPFTIT